jgi:hypothetical protein
MVESWLDVSFAANPFSAWLYTRSGRTPSALARDLASAEAAAAAVPGAPSSTTM